jgi:hypothetical protein
MNDWPIPCPYEDDAETCDRCWASHEDAVPYCTDEDYKRKTKTMKTTDHEGNVRKIVERFNALLEHHGLAPLEPDGDDRNIYKQTTELCFRLRDDHRLLLDVPDRWLEKREGLSLDSYLAGMIAVNKDLFVKRAFCVGCDRLPQYGRSDTDPWAKHLAPWQLGPCCAREWIREQFKSDGVAIEAIRQFVLCGSFRDFAHQVFEAGPDSDLGRWFIATYTV